MTFTGIPNPTDFAALPSEATEKWGTFPGHMGGANFAQLVGLQLEEVRADYARMRVPWRPEIRQPAGMMHVVADESGNLAVRGTLTYKVSTPRPTN